MRPIAKRTQVLDNAGMGEARYQIVRGRRWGRGARPYLLMAKIVFVAVFVGGLISLLTLVLISPLPTTDEGRHIFADVLHRAYAWLIVPSLAGAMIIGVALSASFWRAAVRMRWLQVKALLIVVCVPMLHVFMRKRSLALQSLARTDGTEAQVLTGLRDEVLIGTAAALVFAVLVVLLGRLKPRLGQRYGRARTVEQEPDVPDGTEVDVVLPTEWEAQRASLLSVEHLPDFGQDVEQSQKTWQPPEF